MRTIVVKSASDLLTLSRALFRDGDSCAGTEAVDGATLARIKSLNPHVDVRHLEIGTVLLLPDALELNDIESQSIGGEAFEHVRGHLIEGLKVAAQRLNSAAETARVEHEAVTQSLGTREVKSPGKHDRILGQQLAEARTAFTSEEEDLQKAENQVAAFQDALTEELEKLAKLVP